MRKRHGHEGWFSYQGNGAFYTIFSITAPAVLVPGFPVKYHISLLFLLEPVSCDSCCCLTLTLVKNQVKNQESVYSIGYWASCPTAQQSTTTTTTNDERTNVLYVRPLLFYLFPNPETKQAVKPSDIQSNNQIRRVDVDADATHTSC